jgi:DNA-directed RNA polymerase specialized sigma24 family protein
MAKKIQSLQDIAIDFLENKSDKNFTILIKRLKPGLRKYVYDYVKDVDLCEEIIAMTYINMWEKIDQYDIIFLHGYMQLLRI